MPKIVRVGELKDYTIIENTCLRDKALDIAERGLLVTMLSLPDNWDFSGLGLTSILPCGKSKVFSSLKKLEEAGYLKRKRIYINGKVADWEYYICGRPIFRKDTNEENKSEDIDKSNVDKSSNYVDNFSDFVNKVSSRSDNFKKNRDNLPKTNSLHTEKLFPENQEVGYQEVENLEVENLEAENRYDNKLYTNQVSNNQVFNNQLYNNQLCNNQSINQSNSNKNKRIDGLMYPWNNSEKAMNDYKVYKTIIKNKIFFDDLHKTLKLSEIQILDEIVDIMVDTIAFNKKPIRINGNELPAEIVKSRFLKITYNDIQYILETFSKNTTKIKNIRSYLTTMIYNSHSTINSYYKAEVQHDFYGCG